MKFSGPVVIVASGPSLCQEDVEATAHLPTIAVNNSWEMARHCKVVFAGDNKWWIHNGAKIDIPVHKVSLSHSAERGFDARRFKSKAAKRGGYNSGCIAIEYALVHGASKVILLGFDCSVKHGVHWHGKHKKSPNPDEAKCHRWHKQFNNLRSLYPDADIVNCSRYSELKMFPRMDLECALSSI